MKPQKPWPVKAYKNLEFLTSSDARSIRILAEFEEPLSRFRQLGIKDTIVFFGSSRIIPRPKALRRVKELELQLKRSRHSASSKKRLLEEASVDLEMSRYYEEAVELSRMLTEWSLSLTGDHRFVVCSGGGPGIMEAANKGARLAGGPTIGMNISVPFEQVPNDFIPRMYSFEFHYFFMRKFWFVYLGKALVVFPGGFGTMDELFEVLTLLQTGKIKKKMAVVIYGREYWDKVINFNALVKCHTIRPRDLRLFKFADSPAEAFEYLKSQLTKNYLGSSPNKITL